MSSASSFSTFLDVSQAGRKAIQATGSFDEASRAATVLASVAKGQTAFADLLGAVGMPPSDLVETIGFLSKAGMVRILPAENSFEVQLSDETREALKT
jgi:hypothetical protein